VSNQIANCSIVWNHFNDFGFVSGNPWENVKRPKLAKKAPTIPGDEKIGNLFRWFEEKYPGWELIKLFVRTKILTECRLADLCQVKSHQLAGNVPTILPDQDKTHRERRIPLPSDVVESLHRLKGPTYLWERYTADARTYRPSKHNRGAFQPSTFYHAVKSVFRTFNRTHPESKIKTHDLRKRLITLAVLSGASVDEAAHT
jgi:integrase